MSYARAFERELLRRSITNTHAPITPVTPVTPAKGKERDTYIGFLEGQLDKISVTADLTKLLAEKVEGLQGTLTLHEERLLNQARLLNLTQEAMDQSAQKTARLVADLRTRLDTQQQMAPQPSSPAFDDLLKTVRELEKKFHSLRISALVSAEPSPNTRLEETLRQLQKDLEQVSNRVFSIDADLQRLQQQQQTPPSRHDLRGLLEDAFDEFLPILLREIKAYVRENVDEILRTTSETTDELQTLGNAVQRLKTDVFELQRNKDGVSYLTRSSTDAITLTTTTKAATTSPPKRLNANGDAFSHAYAPFRPLEPPHIPVAIPVAKKTPTTCDSNLLDEERLTAKIRSLLADAFEKVVGGDVVERSQPQSQPQKLVESSSGCEIEAGHPPKIRPNSGKRTSSNANASSNVVKRVGTGTKTVRNRCPGR